MLGYKIVGKNNFGIAYTKDGVLASNKRIGLIRCFRNRKRIDSGLKYSEVRILNNFIQCTDEKGEYIGTNWRKELFINNKVGTILPNNRHFSILRVYNDNGAQQINWLPFTEILPIHTPKKALLVNASGKVMDVGHFYDDRSTHMELQYIRENNMYRLTLVKDRYDYTDGNTGRGVIKKTVFDIDSNLDILKRYV